MPCWRGRTTLLRGAQETGLPIANKGGVKGSRQRYGMLLLALGATFFFEGVLSRRSPAAVGIVLIGGLMSRSTPRGRMRRLRIAAVILTIVAGVVIASVAGKGTTVWHCRHRQRVASRVGASSGCDRAPAHPPRDAHGDRHGGRRGALPLPVGGFVLRLHVHRRPESRWRSFLRKRSAATLGAQCFSFGR